MNRQDDSKNAAPRIQLLKMKQTFLTLEQGNVNVAEMPVEQFDAWASTMVSIIVNVKRDVWDIFARWRFLNCLLGERILTMDVQENGTILLTETEVFSSAELSQAEDYSSVLSTKAG